jgi:hypothetical protein
MIALYLAALSTTPNVASKPIGPDAAQCVAGSTRPAMLVVVEGFKARTGTVRVRTFGGSPSTYFDKKTKLLRTEVPTPREGRVAICMPVDRPGIYAVDVRHDLNGNNKTDRSDGGGASGNPHVTLFDMLFSRKPDPKTVQVRVGAGTTVGPVTLTYLQGGSLKPIG